MSGVTRTDQPVSDKGSATHDQRRIWDHFQGDGIEAFGGSSGRLGYIARRLGAERVLNIGVGNGALEAAAIARGAEVYAVDPSAEAVERVREMLQLGDRARVGFGQDLPFEDETMDTVVVSEVLEHLEDDILKGTLQEIRRVLRPGGRVIGTVPAREDLPRQTVVCPHCAEQYHRWGHAQTFDISSMRALLSGGFKVREISEKVFITWSRLNWKGRIVALTSRILAAFGVQGSNQNIWFIAVKPTASADDKD
jgi:SAM-dependent methyltransferase